MRYRLLLAAVLASTPVCAAEFTDRIELRPGHAGPWHAPRPFSQVHVGNPAIVDVVPASDNQLIITMKPEGGTTNILLTAEDGKLVANLLVTNPAPPPQLGPQLQLAPSAKTGAWQVYRNEDKCWPDCFRNNAPTKPTTKAQSEATPRNPPEGGAGSGAGGG